MSWPTMILDAVTGILRYGHEAYGPNRPAYWRQENVTIVHRNQGNGVSAHYLHNGSIFSAVHIKSYETGAPFVWLKGGNSDALTGSCGTIGN